MINGIQAEVFVSPSVQLYICSSVWVELSQDVSSVFWKLILTEWLITV